MPFVTTVVYESRDRELLDSVVADFRDLASRKGVAYKGPHPAPPETISVPQERWPGGEAGQFDPWEITVYRRTVEIQGHDSFARSIAEEQYPGDVHLSISVEAISQ